MRRPDELMGAHERLLARLEEALAPNDAVPPVAAIETLRAAVIARRWHPNPLADSGGPRRWLEAWTRRGQRYRQRCIAVLLAAGVSLAGGAGGAFASGAALPDPVRTVARDIGFSVGPPPRSRLRPPVRPSVTPAPAQTSPLATAAPRSDPLPSAGPAAPTRPRPVATHAYSAAPGIGWRRSPGQEWQPPSPPPPQTRPFVGTGTSWAPPQSGPRISRRPSEGRGRPGGPGARPGRG